MSCCFRSLFEILEKNGFWFLLTRWDPITASWEGAELLQENNHPCDQQTGCGPLVPLQSSIHSAWEQSEPQSKAQKYNTNKRQINGQDNHKPEICPHLCLYFLTQQFLHSTELFSKPHTWLWTAAGPFIPVLIWCSSCNSVSLKHHWAATWHSTQSPQ